MSQPVVTQVGRQTIVQDSCLNAMERMDARSVDIVCTSPPYNLGIEYSTYADDLDYAAYLSWMGEVFDGIKRILKDGGSFFLNIAGSLRQPWVPFDVAQEARKCFELQNHIVWIKSISIGEQTAGHFKPIPGKRFLNHNHEHLFHFTPTGDTRLDRLAVGVPFMDKSNIGRRGHAADKRCAGNTWFIPYETVRSKAQKFHHPASFPVALPARCIALHGGDADTVVFDPFLGTGTTLVAAHRAGMIGIGTDIDPDYCASAIARLTEEINA